mgnify:CR=1 FL=1
MSFGLTACCGEAVHRCDGDAALLRLNAGGAESVALFVDEVTFYNPTTGGNTTMLHCDSATDPQGNVNCTVADITVMKNPQQSWPAEAQAIVKNAGP